MLFYVLPVVTGKVAKLRSLFKSQVVGGDEVQTPLSKLQGVVGLSTNNNEYTAPLVSSSSYFHFLLYILFKLHTEGRGLATVVIISVSLSLCTACPHTYTYTSLAEFSSIYILKGLLLVPSFIYI